MKKHAVIVMMIASACLVTSTTVAAQQRRPTLPIDQQTPLGIILDRLDNLTRAWSETLPAELRFKLVFGDAAVLDRETGLVWERSPSKDRFGRDITFTWTNGDAEIRCVGLSVGNRKGWRLPTIQELLTLVDPTQVDPNPSANRPPALPAGHPFTVTSNSRYWSANTIGFFRTEAWGLDFTGFCTLENGVSVCTTGFPAGFDKNDRLSVWCVRGQGVDPR